MKEEARAKILQRVSRWQLVIRHYGQNTSGTNCSTPSNGLNSHARPPRPTLLSPTRPFFQGHSPGMLSAFISMVAVVVVG
jgi:hypothetical protein